MNPELPNNPREELELRVTALLLGELSEAEAATVRGAIAQDAELQKLHDDLKQTIYLVRETTVNAAEPTEEQSAPLKLSEERRQSLLTAFVIPPLKPEHVKAKSRIRLTLIEVLVAVAIMALVASMLLPSLAKSKGKATSVAVRSNLRQLDAAKEQWALEHENRTDTVEVVPTMEDLKPYLGRGESEELLKPVAGEKYVVGKVGEPVTAELNGRKVTLGEEQQLFAKASKPAAKGGSDLRFRTWGSDNGERMAVPAPQPGTATVSVDPETRRVFVVTDDESADQVRKVTSNLNKPAKGSPSQLQPRPVTTLATEPKLAPPPAEIVLPKLGAGDAVEIAGTSGVSADSDFFSGGGVGGRRSGGEAGKLSNSDSLERETIHLNYANPSDVRSAIAQTLADGRSEMQADARNNQLAIVGTPKDLQVAEELAARLDTPTKQVLVEAHLEDRVAPRAVGGGGGGGQGGDTKQRVELGNTWYEDKSGKTDNNGELQLFGAAAPSAAPVEAKPAAPIYLGSVNPPADQSLGWGLRGPQNQVEERAANYQTFESVNGSGNLPALSAGDTLVVKPGQVDALGHGVHVAGIIADGAAPAKEPNSLQKALSATTVSGYADTSAEWATRQAEARPQGKVDGFNMNVVKLDEQKPLDEQVVRRARPEYESKDRVGVNGGVADASSRYDTPPLDFDKPVTIDGKTYVHEFVGYNDQGQFASQAQSASGDSGGVGLPLTAQLPLPHFKLTPAHPEQAANGSTVWVADDGSARVLNNSVSKLKDKVPVLGDLPAIGRFFRSESNTKPEISEEQRQKNIHSVMDAKLLFERGKYDEAEAKMAEVLKAEPGNYAATYYSSLAKEQRDINASLPRAAQSKQRILKVEDAWEVPTKRDKLSMPQLATNAAILGAMVLAQEPPAKPGVNIRAKFAEATPTDSELPARSKPDSPIVLPAPPLASDNLLTSGLRDVNQSSTHDVDGDTTYALAAGDRKFTEIPMAGVSQVIRKVVLKSRDRISAPNPFAQTNLVNTGGNRAEIVSKLDGIKPDSVMFDGLPSAEVVRKLTEESKRQNLDKKGMNFILAPNFDSTTGQLKAEAAKSHLAVTSGSTSPTVIDAPLPRKPATNAPIAQSEIQTSENNFSTFSLNVSDVSFKLAAASLEKGQMPDSASIRSEEFINAFDYRDPEPKWDSASSLSVQAGKMPAPLPGAPIAFAWERARYPFAHNRDLLRFSLKTAAAGRQAGRPLNVVLLLDNSGSMERADRVSIIREALRVLATQLQPQDKLSVITFARTPRLVADGIAGDKACEVAEQVSGLTPEGGTNLEDAMNLAYQTAAKHFLANGINRVVVMTDGAANLGDVEPESLKQKVETNRKQGIALDCFGVGWDGFNDDLLEVLSRNGDGRYGFINSPEEAASEFAGQLAGALKVAASDVKVQVEWNPKRVTAYRQIGYAKHQLTKEQFRDNTVDAAEIAAQEAGNALYTVEVNPAGEGPLGTVRVRYKIPGTSDYREQAWDVPFNGNAASLDQSSAAMRLATSASAFSEWLAVNPFAGEVTTDALLKTLSGVPEVFGADSRPKKLEWMIRQAKSLEGK